MKRITLLIIAALSLAACDQSYGGYASQDASENRYTY